MSSRPEGVTKLRVLLALSVTVFPSHSLMEPYSVGVVGVSLDIICGVIGGVLRRYSINVGLVVGAYRVRGSIFCSPLVYFKWVLLR